MTTNVLSHPISVERLHNLTIALLSGGYVRYGQWADLLYHFVKYDDRGRTIISIACDGRNAEVHNHTTGETFEVSTDYLLAHH